MTNFRKLTILAGISLIIATAAGIFNAVALAPLIGHSDFLAEMSKNADSVMLSTLLNIVMAISVTAIAIILFPILKRESEALAAGYLAARICEGLVLAISGLAWLTMISLGKDIVLNGLQAGSSAHQIGDLVLSANTSMFTLAAEIVFGLSAIILNYVLFKAKLVPALISLWGLGGGILILLLGSMKILGMDISAVEIAFTAPIALNEMVLAVWLIVKGMKIREE